MSKIVCIFCKKAWGVELYHDTCQGREVSDLLQVALDTLPDRSQFKDVSKEAYEIVGKQAQQDLLDSKKFDYVVWLIECVKKENIPKWFFSYEMRKIYGADK